MGDSKTILLVEDNAHDEQLILRALGKANVVNHVDVLRDGQQALDWLFGEAEFRTRGTMPLPAVVLLDINLPRVNGLEVLGRLRADPQDPPAPGRAPDVLFRGGGPVARLRTWCEQLRAEAPRFRGVRRDSGPPGRVLAGRQRTAPLRRLQWLNP